MDQPSTSRNAQFRYPPSIIEALKIPDVIKDLQVFDGNPKLLQNFIENVEEILLLCRGYEDTPQGTIFLRAIRNKIMGDANETLNSYLTPLAWEAIKENLTITYGDKRDETTLVKELHSLNQGFMSIEKFYAKIVEIQSALLNRIANTETNRSVIEAKKKLYVEMCLNSFNTGIKGPIGSMLRSTQPKDLSTAFEYIIKEKDITYRNKYLNDNMSNKSTHYRPQYRYTPNPFNRQPTNNYQPSYNNRQNFNRQYTNESNYNRHNFNRQYSSEPNYNRQTTNNFRNTNQTIPHIKQSDSTMYRNNNSRNTSYTRQSGNLKME